MSSDGSGGQASTGGAGNAGGADSSNSSTTGSIVVEGDTTGNPNTCRRVVSLEGVTLGTPPPFDVVIVADNSESLSWSREELGQGLSDLMANVYGHSVRFFVLTPTQYEASSENAIDLRTGEELVNWRDPGTGTPYTHAVTRYVTACKDAFGDELVCPGYPPPALDFELQGTWEFALPEPVAELHSDMSVAELDAERGKVVTAILAVGIEGSPQEQPVCTLARYVRQPARHLPERAVFLVISDEDDTTSTEESCLGGYHYKQLATTNSTLVEGCTQNCDLYRYQVSRPLGQNSFSFECAPVDDLGNVGAADTWKTGSFKRTVESCSIAVDSCTDEELDWAQAECDSGYFVQTCTRSCADNAATTFCTYSSTEPTQDLCTQAFDGAGGPYANLTDYCEQVYQASGWGSCTGTGLARQDSGVTFTKTSLASPVVGAQSVDDMIYLFHSDAERAFGEDNYFVESILFTEDSMCVPQAGQSYATELAKIASSPEQVYPICESYQPALASVNRFAQELLQTEYPLELGERESIESVVVEARDGSSRELDSDAYRYDAEQSLLLIDPSALSSADLKLNVEVLDPCAPPIK